MGSIRTFYSGPLAAATLSASLVVGCVSVNDATALSGQLTAEFKRSATVTLDGRRHLIVTLQDDPAPGAPAPTSPANGTAPSASDSAAPVDSVAPVASAAAADAPADGTMSATGVLEQRIARFSVEHFAHPGAVRTVTVILEPAGTNRSADAVVSTWTAAELAPPVPLARPATRTD
jgi:hypothetical protein